MMNMRALLLFSLLGLAGCYPQPRYDVIVLQDDFSTTGIADDDSFLFGLLIDLAKINASNKKICAEEPLAQCMENPEKTLKIRMLDRNPTYQVKAERAVTLLYKAKKGAPKGKVVFKRQLLEMPDLSYVPTAGFLGSPVEEQMRAVFTSGVYLTRDDIIRMSNKAKELKKVEEKGEKK